MERYINEGQFLINVRLLNAAYKLYSLYNHYVELELSQDGETIMDVRAFKQGEGLDKYLGEIDLSDVLTK